MLLFLTCFALAAQPLSAEVEQWSKKAVGFYCDSSICRCTLYYDTESGKCWVIVDATGTKCTVFKMRGDTYNAYFEYNDCNYFLSNPYWPTGR
jgi:hypothetical protein